MKSSNRFTFFCLCSTLFFTLFFVPIANAEKAPELSGSTLMGPAVKYDATKPALIVFWASWCGNCLAEIPQLKALHKRLSNSIQFLGVNVNKHPEDGIKTVTDYQIPYPSLSDPDLTVADQFGVRGTPTLIAIDDQGYIVHYTHRLDKTLITTLESLHH